MFKKDIRSIYLEKRTSISNETKIELDTAILSQFKSLNLGGINLIHCYLPILSKNEINTLPIINYILEIGKEVVVPKSDFNTSELSHYLINSNLIIEINKWGIDEPITGDIISVSEIDMVIVPLLAYDEEGFRVGYGKGYYDKFLKECKPGTKFIGLSYFEPISLISDIETHDVALHQCLTPIKFYNFW